MRMESRTSQNILRSDQGSLKLCPAYHSHIISWMQNVFLEQIENVAVGLEQIQLFEISSHKSRCFSTNKSSWFITKFKEENCNKLFVKNRENEASRYFSTSVHVNTTSIMLNGAFLLLSILCSSLDTDSARVSSNHSISLLLQKLCYRDVTVSGHVLQ